MIVYVIFISIKGESAVSVCVVRIFKGFNFKFWLTCLFSIFHLEYPSVLSRFRFEYPLALCRFCFYFPTNAGFPSVGEHEPGYFNGL